ncbi:MAG: SusC/RagA family TonB-linked outer membrane protein [Cyclobacteriaceae bacterium]
MKKRVLKLLLMGVSYTFAGFVFQLLFINMLWATETHAQRVKSIKDVMVRVEIQDKTLMETFSILERKSPFKFVYDKNDAFLTQKFNIEMQTLSIEDILVAIARENKLRFKQVNHNITVSKPATFKSEEIEVVDTSIEITGTVTDENGEPLPGVTVVIEGTNTGTVSDIDGKYTIDADVGAVLVYSFVGFQPQRQTVGSSGKIDVRMTEDFGSLDEVVVVGYGSVKKSDLTGSVSSVSSKELVAVPVSNIGSALQGRAAGVDVVQGDGSPGSMPRIRIRGGNSITGGNEPLYVIDGFPVTGGLEGISPNDIESIEVLKDASATAIYGSRGANGVVLVSTKQGVLGAPKVTFETYLGVNHITNRPQLLDAEQYIALANEALVNDGMPPMFTEPVSSYGNTDWQEEILQPGIQQNHQLTVSGGTESTRYSFSGNFFKEQGVVRNSDFSRGNIRFNIDSKISDRLTIGSNITLGRTSDNTLPTAGNGSVDRGGVISTALLVPPIVPIYDIDGNYIFQYEDYLGQNPVAMVNEMVNESVILRGFGNAFAEYELINGLRLKVSLGTNLNYQKNNSYLPTNTFQGSAQNGIASVNMVQNYNWLNENTLSYQTNIGEDHSINLLGGFTRQQNKTESLSGSASDFITNAFLYNSLQSGNAPGAPRTNASDWALESYLGRINYIFRDKYLLTATARYDGSSRFGVNKKYGFFPSGSLAWRISEEEFMKMWGNLDDLKLRASYGITGNQAIPSYGSLSSLTASAGFGYIFGGVPGLGVGPSSIGNEDLGWEKTKQMDIGLDASLFGGRINFTADFYHKITEDLLLNANLPNHTGFRSAIRNIGSIENKGVEFTIGSDILVNQFTWNTSLNLTANRNRVMDLGETGEQLTGGGPVTIGINQYSIIKEGEPLGAFYGYIFDGIYQSEEQVNELGHQPLAKTGDLIYRDLNGDGILNQEDRMILGKALPNFILGFDNHFSYRNFDLNIFFVSYLGTDRLHLNRYILEFLNGVYNHSTAVLERWTPDNPSNYMPRATRTGHQYRVSTREVEDASFIRLRNLSLGYNIPSHILSNLKINNLRFYVTGMNLFTITNYTGFDPEIGTTNDRNPGGDYGNYPMPRTLILGLNVVF